MTLIERLRRLASTDEFAHAQYAFPDGIVPIGGTLDEAADRIEAAAEALQRYEQLPVDADDRPESWARLDALLDAVRALAPQVKSGQSSESPLP